jgi:hypothetical protein
MKDNTWLLVLAAFIAGAIIVYLILKKDNNNSGNQNIQNVNYAVPPVYNQPAGSVLPDAPTFVNNGTSGTNVPDSRVYKLGRVSDMPISAE